MSHLKSLHLQNFLNNLWMVDQGGRGTRFAENQVTEYQPSSKGRQWNRHRNSLGEKDPTAFMYTQTHTLQRCPWHLRIFSKTCPSANEDHFQPSEFTLSSKGREKCCESLLFISVPTLRAKAGQSSPFTKPWQGFCDVSLLQSHHPCTLVLLLLPSSAEGSSSLFILLLSTALSKRPLTNTQSYTFPPRLSSHKEDVKRSAEEARGRKTREDIAKTSCNSGCRPSQCPRAQTPWEPLTPRAACPEPGVCCPQACPAPVSQQLGSSTKTVTGR